MKLGTMIEGLQKLSPLLYDVLQQLNTDLEVFFSNFKADDTGISFGDLKWSKKGLLESTHGIFVRKQIESDTPICAIYCQAGGNIAGAGNFTWDTLVFESLGYFTRITGNTQIQIMRPGKYLVTANLLSYGNAAGARGDVNFSKNAAVQLATIGYAGFDGFIPFTLAGIIDFAANDVLDVPSNVGRYGGAAGVLTTLSIHKLN